jgi:hypothetical protein
MRNGTVLSTEERALRGLVFGYLAKEYPRAAQLMEAQAILDDFEAGIDGADAHRDDGVAVHASVAIANVFGPNATLRAVVHRRVAGKKRPTPKASPRLAPAAPAKKPVVADSDSDNEAPAATQRPTSKKPSPKSSPKHAPAQARRPVPVDSDDDEAPAAAAKKPSPKAKPAAAKKPVVHDSDSDDEPAKKPVVNAKKASPKLAAAKPKPMADSDDDEPPKKPASRKASPKASPKVAPAKPTKAPAMDSSDDEAVRPAAKKLSPKAAPARAQGEERRGAPAGKKAPGERFCRINVEAVQFASDRLKDNRCRDDVSGFTQNQKMLQVRGKEFNKHKQKNKAKLYAAGVDQGVHSYKFSDAEEE